MTMPKNIIVFKDLATLSQEAAHRFVILAKEAIALHGRFSVVLAGGTTPKAMYEILSRFSNSELDWGKVFLFWGDERFVSPTDENSTYLMIKEALLEKIPILAQNIFPIPTTNGSIEECASLYSKTLVKYAGNPLPCFDLVLLGMGSDGHTASLFPHSKTLSSKELVTVELNSPKLPALRITLTHKIINNAKNVIFMVTGQDKAVALQNVLEGERNIDQFPAQGVNITNGTVAWLIDQAAASRLGTLSTKN